MPSGNELVTNALRLLGVVGATETPSGEDLEFGFDRLNDWIDAQQLDRLTIHALSRTTKTLTASTASYQIGVGAAINVARPLWIDAAMIVLDTTATYPTETPIHIFSDQEWPHIPQKTATGTAPTGIYYDHKWISGAGTIYVYPIPTVSTTQLVLYTPLAITEFADQATDYLFSPGYRRMILHNLAIELTTTWMVPQDVYDKVNAIAVSSKAAVKRANYRPTELGLDPAFLGRSGAYNIESDQ
jgi:hypothetical protein